MHFGTANERLFSGSTNDKVLEARVISEINPANQIVEYLGKKEFCNLTLKLPSMKTLIQKAVLKERGKDARNMYNYPFIEVIGVQTSMLGNEEMFIITYKVKVHSLDLDQKLLVLTFKVNNDRLELRAFH